MMMRRGRTTQSRMELSRRMFWDWDPDGTACGDAVIVVRKRSWRRSVEWIGLDWIELD